MRYYENESGVKVYRPVSVRPPVDTEIRYVVGPPPPPPPGLPVIRPRPGASWYVGPQVYNPYGETPTPPPDATRQLVVGGLAILSTVAAAYAGYHYGREYGVGVGGAVAGILFGAWPVQLIANYAWPKR